MLDELVGMFYKLDIRSVMSLGINIQVANIGIQYIELILRSILSFIRRDISLIQCDVE